MRAAQQARELGEQKAGECRCSRTSRQSFRAFFKNLRNRGKLTEKDVDLALKEVRMALFGGRCQLQGREGLCSPCPRKGGGREVLASLTPAQQVIKIVHEELTDLMGGQSSKITFAPKPPTLIMLVGLQGSGKTTTCGKLAALLRGRAGSRSLRQRTSTGPQPSDSCRCLAPS